jgi:hypothetical protein
MWLKFVENIKIWVGTKNFAKKFHKITGKVFPDVPLSKPRIGTAGRV